ncbi:hypothetical protein N7456_013251 [Penicillium angulare]|uniref:Uncharacterized protein n=1 Tax=Penicillium angulare TaxID=116970 RepID=A0A9W9EL97_9EURO|nr:hypothetical protein N7456_013251 [Penicillium angulare]
MASETNRSNSIESEHPHLDEDQSSRLYIIYRKPFRRHYEVKSSVDQLIYYGEVSSFTRGKPDIILHRGTSANAPVVAASKIIKLSGNFKLALGNPDDVNNVQWEDMTKDSWKQRTYRFEVNMPDQTRRVFLWKRTRMSIDGSTHSWRSRNYKLVDERTKELVAVLTNKRSLSEGSKLQIKEDHGEWFDRVILLAYISIHEKLRRRDNQNAAVAAGS